MTRQFVIKIIEPDLSKSYLYEEKYTFLETTKDPFNALHVLDENEGEIILSKLEKAGLLRGKVAQIEKVYTF